jgi:hypothetical protein
MNPMARWCKVHRENGMPAVKELARSYVTISKDQARVMTRVKALYRSWGIACSGKQIYTVRHRASWLGKIKEPSVRRRAEFYYQQLDGLRSVPPASAPRVVAGE